MSSCNSLGTPHSQEFLTSPVALCCPSWTQTQLKSCKPYEISKAKIADDLGNIVFGLISGKSKKVLQGLLCWFYFLNFLFEVIFSSILIIIKST